MIAPADGTTRSPLAEKLGRLAGLAVDAAVSHSRSHCCCDAAPSTGATPGGRPDGVPDTGGDPAAKIVPPTGQPELVFFPARPAQVQCRPSFTDTVGSVGLTYEAPTAGLTLQASPVRRVTVGELPSTFGPTYGVGVQPYALQKGPNDVVATMDHGGNGPEPGLYVGSVTATPTTQGNPTRRVLIYVDGLV